MWLTQHKFIFSEFWRLQVHGQGVSMFFSRKTSWLAVATLPSCPHLAFRAWGLSLLRRAPVLLDCDSTQP